MGEETSRQNETNNPSFRTEQRKKDTKHDTKKSLNTTMIALCVAAGFIGNAFATNARLDREIAALKRQRESSRRRLHVILLQRVRSSRRRRLVPETRAARVAANSRRGKIGNEISDLEYKLRGCEHNVCGYTEAMAKDKVDLEAALEKKRRDLMKMSAIQNPKLTTKQSPNKSFPARNAIAEARAQKQNAALAKLQIP